MTVRVRATEKFQGYEPVACRVIEMAAHEEVTGELAVFLATTGAPVEVLEDTDGVLGGGISRPGPYDVDIPVEDEAPDADLEPTGGDVDEPPAAAEPSSPDQVIGAPGPAGDSADDPAAILDPSSYKVDEVLAYARAHPEQAQALAAAERAGRARTTLLTGLADLTD